MPAMAPSCVTHHLKLASPTDHRSIADTWRAFWHSVTTSDRHASHDSPYRTSGHVALAQSKHAPLTSVATSGFESKADLSDAPDSSTPFAKPANGRASPSTPYSPGRMSALRRQSTDRSSIDKNPPAEIQMQNFNDGLPPPPPVSHSWKRIERWAEDNYTELFDNLCEGATRNDVNELEHDLDCTLPVDVRESLMVHDGQERGGLPTGILFGCMLLDCEEIVEEWQNWRTVNEQFLQRGSSRPTSLQTPQIPVKAFASASSSSNAPTSTADQQKNSLWRDELLARQDSQPPNAVQKAYAHPAWVPLARDWGGNCIAVDLAPGPTGKWGQIILFGRDYDCKFVIARSWAAFLAAVADDFGTPKKIFVDEENHEFRFRQFRDADPPYLEVLRWRCDQKHGRRQGQQQRRRVTPTNGLRINANVSNVGAVDLMNGSPYTSPTSERGRSPQRFPLGKQSATTASPRRQHVSSPLARVAEETPRPITVNTELKELPVQTTGQKPQPPSEKLVSVDTPRPSGDFEHVFGVGKDKESAGLGKKDNVVNPTSTAVEGGKVKADTFVAGGDASVEEMKSVAL